METENARPTCPIMGWGQGPAESSILAVSVLRAAWALALTSTPLRNQLRERQGLMTFSSTRR